MALRLASSYVARGARNSSLRPLPIRMSGVNTDCLRETALALHGGGVGYDPHSNLVQVDVGRVRQWCFECIARHVAGN